MIPYENNPRDNSKAIEQVAKSLKAYGWRQPLVVDKDHVIIVGHTRYQAAILNGETEVPCIVADDMTPEQAAGYRLADNKTSDFSIWDNKMLLEELDALDGLDIFTGFELGGLFDSTLDEDDNDVLKENEVGMIYEVVFKSEDKAKIDRIVSLWEAVDGEESGNEE